jgi:cell division protein FtsA
MDVICNPIHATGVGLLLYGFENISRRDRRSTPIGGNLGEVLERMKSWFKGQF